MILRFSIVISPKRACDKILPFSSQKMVRCSLFSPVIQSIYNNEIRFCFLISLEVIEILTFYILSFFFFLFFFFFFYGGLLDLEEAPQEVGCWSSRALLYMGRERVSAGSVGKTNNMRI